MKLCGNVAAVIILLALAAGIVPSNCFAYSISGTYHDVTDPDPVYNNDWWEYDVTIESGDSQYYTFRVYMGWKIEPSVRLVGISETTGNLPSGYYWVISEPSFAWRASNKVSYVEWQCWSENGTPTDPSDDYLTSIPTGSYNFKFVDNPDDDTGGAPWNLFSHPGPWTGGKWSHVSTTLLAFGAPAATQYGDPVPMSPEPGSLGLVGMALFGLAIGAFRRSRKGGRG